MITIQKLKELLHYDPETGFFTWLVSGHGVHVGMRAGSFVSNGYRRIGVSNGYYLEHRLAWFYMRGEWPSHTIDHRDHDAGNNTWSNLRSATRSQNQHNHRIGSNNTSGVKGVTWSKARQKWNAEIVVNGKREYFCTFTDKDKAITEIKAARIRLHGEFAKH